MERLHPYISERLQNATSRAASDRMEAAPDRGGFAHLALVVLALILPFELRTPWLNVGSAFVLTNVELVMALVLALWLATLVVERRLPRSGMSGAWAVVVLAGAMLLSALAAPSHRGEALKFTLRSVTGMAVFFAALDLVRTSRQRRAVIAALLAGVTVSAALGLLEAWAPGMANGLSIFKTSPTRIGALLRVSGTFEYTNIAAMVWEATLPLAFIAVGREGGQRRIFTILGFVAIAVLSEALILTLSRAGLIGAAGALAIMALIVWRRGDRRLLRNILYGGILLVVLIVLTYVGTPATVARLFSESDASWYQVSYKSPPSLTLRAGQIEPVKVTVRNESVITWPATGPNRVALSYHFLDPNTREIVHLLGYRAPLPYDLGPGEEVTIDMLIYALRAPGQYLLMWDMVQESPDPDSVVWFSVKSAASGPSPFVPVNIVAEGGTAQPPPAPRAEQQLPAPIQPSRLTLWQIAFTLFRERPILGIGPDNFRHLYGPYTGYERWDDRIHTNNMYIEALVNLGLIGGAAFLVVLALGLFWSLQTASYRGEGAGNESRWATGLSGALVAFTVHGLFDYFLEFTSTYLLFWMILGLSAGLWRDTILSARRPPAEG